MSGSPSEKFIGRSFNTPDPANPQGYSTNTPLTSPSGGNSFLIASHVRVNGIQALGSAMLESLDVYGVPATQGFGLGLAPVADSPADADTFVSLNAALFGGGESALANIPINDVTGMFGQELFLYLWYLQDVPITGGSLMVGFNGKLSTPIPMSNNGSFTPSGTPAILGVGCLPGVASVASVGIYQIPGGAAALPSLQEVAQATAQLAMASMKFGRLTLFDPQIVPNGNEGILWGKDWDHYWTSGRTSALAPATLPDEGSVGTATMNLDVAQSDTSLIVMPGRNYASGLFLNG